MIREAVIFGAGAAVGAYAALRTNARISVVRIPTRNPVGPLGASPGDFNDMMDDLLGENEDGE